MGLREVIRVKPSYVGLVFFYKRSQSDWPCEIREKVAGYEKAGPPPDKESAGSLTLDFPVYRTMRHKFLSFISHEGLHFVIATQMQ